MDVLANTDLPADVAAKALLVTRRICEVAKPKMIVLFGSQARRDTHAHSDFDFLIVHDRADWQESTRHREVTRLYKAVGDVPFAKDLLLFTAEQVNLWRHAKSHVVAQAMADGIILYERAA